MSTVRAWWLGVIAAITLASSAALAQSSRIGPPLPELLAPQPVTVPAPTGRIVERPGSALTDALLGRTRDDESRIAPLEARQQLVTPDLDRSAAEMLADPTGINPLEILGRVGGQLDRQPGRQGSGEEGGSRSGGLSTAINILVVLTVVSLAPSIMLMTTCFVRILIVLGLLRQALGTTSIPPPQVITALALFMTLLVMSPTLDRINREAIGPYRAGEIKTYDELWDRAKQPVRDYMFAQIEASGNWSSLYMVLEYRGVDVSRPEALTRADVDMISLLPAYMLSELKIAFLMGFKIYLPFLVIDMVISTLLIAMGMMMLPPVLISLPFKLLLFVLVDGWALVVGGLLASFAQPATGTETAQLLPQMQQLLHGADVGMTLLTQTVQEGMRVASPWVASSAGWGGAGGLSMGGSA